jgi:uncharacterized protein YciI
VAKTFFAVFQRPDSRGDPDRYVRDQAQWDGHASHMDALFDRGLIVLGGPFPDQTGSMVIVRARDASEARAMFRDDRRTVEDILVVADVKEWTIFLDDSDRQQAD